MPQPIKIGTIGPSQAGDAFGRLEQLVWIDETLPVSERTNHAIWDHPYAAIRALPRIPSAWMRRSR